MPTLEELFKNKKYDRLEGKTPQEAFAVKNSKDIQISTTSALLNSTSVKLINKARLGTNANRFSETRIESELIGLLPFTNYSEPVLYGTDILRISSQNTSLGEAMKAGTGGRGLAATVARVVGDTVGEAVQFGGSKLLKVPATFNAKSALTKAGAALKNTLGAFFPDVLIPSKIVLSPMFSAKLPGFSEEYRTHEVLARLKDISAGTKVASFLAKNATGTPDQIKNAVIGQGINIAQQQAKKIVSNQLVKILSKGGDKAQQLAKEIQQSTNLSIRYSSLKKYTDIVKGVRQFGNPPLNFGNQEYKTPDSDTEQRNDLSTKYIIEFSGEADDKKRKGKFLKEKNQAESNYNDGATTGIYKYSKVPRKSDRETIMDFNGGDIKNLQGVGNINNDLLEVISETDYVPLKFTSVATSTAVIFRGTITGLSEQFSPSWDTSRFIGAPFNFYTYQSIERTVQFSFKVFSLSSEEHRVCWEKLAYLSSLCYPQNYTNSTGAVSAPFLKFTLGDMYRNKECFIENLSYNIDDNYPWEVGLNGKASQNYRLPMIVEVTITLKFIEAKSNTFSSVTGSDGFVNSKSIGTKMYGFTIDENSADKQNDKTFTSTTQPDKPFEAKKPSSEKNQVETGDPYPNDSSEEALKLQKRMKLSDSLINHTPKGQTKPRKVYIQKKTDRLYFGDGTPYSGVGDITDYIDTPINKSIGLNPNGFDLSQNA